MTPAQHEALAAVGAKPLGPSPVIDAARKALAESKPEARPYWGAPQLGRACSCSMPEDLARQVRTAPAMFGPCRCARCGGDIDAETIGKAAT